MMTDFERTVREIYERSDNQAPKKIEPCHVEMAKRVSEMPRPSCAEDFLKVIASLNLLNAAIKQSRWQKELSYGKIKPRTSDILDMAIDKGLKDVVVRIDPKSRIGYMKVFGVVFSFHYIPMTARMLAYVLSGRNADYKWPGIRLQKIAVEVFELAMQIDCQE